MSRPNNITCDRCGREITETYCSNYYNSGYGDTCRRNLKWAKLNIWPPESKKGLDVPQRIDLCSDCYDKCVNFLEEEQ